MLVWLGFAVLAAFATLTGVILWAVRQFGHFTEQNARENRALIHEMHERTDAAAREINASTALLHASLIDSLGTIARIRKDGGNLPPDGEVPPPVTFTAEDVA